MFIGEIIETDNTLFTVETSHVGMERVSILSPANFLCQIILYFRNHITHPFTSKPQQFVNASIRSMCSFNDGLIDRISFESCFSQLLNEKLECWPVSITGYCHVSCPEKLNFCLVSHH